jgi:serine protease Do
MSANPFKWLVVCGAILMALAAPVAAAEISSLGALVDAARAAGVDAPDIARMTLAEGTSRTLLKIDGDIDFPFSVGIDLPLTAEPRSLNIALHGPVEDTGRFVVIFDVALAKVSRRVRDMKDHMSRKVVAINKIDNPAFQRAVKQYDSSSVRLEKRGNNSKLVQQFEDARVKVNTTPQYLEQLVYGDYAVKMADLEGTKSLTVNYVVVDRVANTYMKSMFDVVEHQRFTIAYGVDQSDPNQASFFNDVATEAQVRNWERASVIIPLSQLLDHAVAAGGPAVAGASTEAVLEMVANDRNRANARYHAGAYDARSLKDPRFNSVVAIYTATGMGSGFYVRPNIVMTNWHVVERQPIVELRRYDKTETFGQVIAKDLLLDLALVKVQDRGNPVEFFQGKDLHPGDSVEAIGHPHRQLFSITRGVVSAIRKMRANTNETQPSKENFYIQTDADINPGNSGGPLFLGNKVVGINTFGLGFPKSGENAPFVPMPGLNFSVHYDAAKKFLDDSMRGE